MTRFASKGTRDAAFFKLKRRLKGDLDNIVLKALRKEPERRYASVEQFAEDIRRHLKGLPVVARKDTPGYRTGKFVTRHKMGVVAAGFVFVLLLGGMAAIIREARIARTERSRAERHFNDVRKLANSFLFEFHDAIQNLPGSTPARELVVQRALEYLGRLAQEAGNDLSLQRELATAYEKVGNLQGNPLHSNLGDPAGSLLSYRKALAIRQAIVAANPHNTEDEISLAAAYRQIGEVQWMSLDGSTEALENLSTAVAIAQKAAAGSRGDSDAILELAMSYKRLGDLQGGNGPRGSLGDMRHGLEKHKQALSLFLQIADANPADLTKKTLLAASLSSVADDLVKLGDRDQAIDYYKRTLELEKPLAEDTSNPTLRSNLAVDYSRIGDTLVLSGRPEDALNNFREALRLIEPMAKADPKDTNLQAKLVLSRASIGNALVEDGRLAEGQHLLLQSLAEAENLARTAGDSQDRTILAFVEVWTGEAMEKAKDISRALQHYTVALQMYSEISKADPKDLEDAVSVVATYDHLGSAYLKLRNINTAQEQYRKALTVAESLVSSHSENMEVLIMLADTEAGLGDVSAARVRQTESVHDPAQRWMEARDWYRRSLSTWQKIPNPSHISPNGFEVADPREIAHRLAECMAHTSDTERQSWKAR